MTPVEVSLDVSPSSEPVWFQKHVAFSAFQRQGIQIICASFKHADKKSVKGNVVVVTGWSESFMKYVDLIKMCYELGFDVYTYDHQSQGLSGRWLSENQSTYVESFEDYVDDFVYFMTTVVQEDGGTEGSAKLPNYLIACSMGGLVTSIAMTRQPTLINRAVLVAPMFRNKCSAKYLDHLYPLPQQLVYWISTIACYAGLGATHALGYFLERPEDPLKVNITTSDIDQLHDWAALRQRHPQIMSTCVTNKWVLESIKAQKKFAHRYKLVRTNMLLLSAEHDRFVHNRAMNIFSKSAPHSQIFFAPDACHELLFEKPAIRGAAYRAITDFFTQTSDDVALVQPPSPFELQDHSQPVYTVAENMVRLGGLACAGMMLITGVAMVFSETKFLRK